MTLSHMLFHKPMRWVDGHAFSHNSLVGEAREDRFSHQHGHNYSLLGLLLSSSVNATLQTTTSLVSCSFVINAQALSATKSV
jgi:hypothetical protein